MKKIINNKNTLIALGKELALAYKDCFTKESTEKWIKMFAKKRLETLLELNEEDYGIKVSRANQQAFVRAFTASQLELINQPKEDDTNAF